VDRRVTGPIETTYLKETLLILGTAGVVVPLMHRWKLSPILGYLAAGVALGPHGLGEWVGEWPMLSAVTVEHIEGIAGLAEFGVVFLLFVIGLELSLERLSTMRRWVFGVGGLQMLVSTVLIGLIATRFGLTPEAAMVVGAGLAMSSTAIIIEMLARSRRLTTTTGRATFAVLLLQDLAVVPLLFLVGALGGETGQGLAAGLALAFAQAAAAIAGIVTFGRLALAPLYRVVAATRSPEIFTATTLLVVIGTAVATASAGLSMALGAFVAGLLLAETEYRRAVEATIDPFKGLLLGVFFFSVGMTVDPEMLIARPGLILTAAALLLVVKGLVMAAVARAFRLPWPVAIEAAFLTGPGGEFAFIVTGMAVATKLVSDEVGGLILTVVSLTMVALPFYGEIGRKLARRYERVRPLDAELQVAPPADHGRRALIIGYGRVGEVVTGLLDAHDQPYLVVDANPTTVTLARRRGRPVYYGDGADPLFLIKLDLAEATAVILTLQDFAAIDRVVTSIRRLRPDVPIVARARDAKHATHLYELGVTDAVPETVEASFQLSEAALINLGVSVGPIIASIHDRRAQVRETLKAAKRDAL
jgi:CPA2 family monovalent cation:H+ antiporter-2